MSQSRFRKFFTLSYDDGLQQDKRIIEMLKKYGIRGTFNLNSDLFGSKGDVEYFSVYGFHSVEKGHGRNGKLIRSCSSDRVPADEIAQVYAGFEIATHTVHHANVNELSREELERELLEDQKALQQYTQIPVVGHAYPSGQAGEEVEKALRDHHFLYARTIVNHKGNGWERFAFPDNPLLWNPTCWQIQKDIEKLLDQFLAIPAEHGDMLFYMWGHGYELDFEAMKKRKFWTTFERMLDRVAQDDSIMKCTNAEAILMHGTEA